MDNALMALFTLAALSVTANWLAGRLLQTTKAGTQARDVMYDAAFKLADAPRDRVPAAVAHMAAALVAESRGWFHITRSLIFPIFMRTPERARVASEFTASVNRMEPELQQLYHRVLAGFILSACSRDPLFGGLTFWLLRRVGKSLAQQAPPDVERKIVMTFGPTDCHA